MPRLNYPATRPFYAAAQRFIDVALRPADEPGSLFAPGQAIWTPPLIEELQCRLVPLPVQSDAAFLAGLRQQLAGAPAPLFLLAAEALFVHLLPLAGELAPQHKRQLVAAVAAWSPEPFVVPTALAQALDQGIARASAAFFVYRPFQLAFLLAFVGQWQRLAPAERVRALADPWDFKVQLFALPASRAYAQREALLHLVHPESFEPLLSRSEKRRLVRAAVRRADMATMATDDVDQQLAQLRDRSSSHGARPPARHALPCTLGPRLRPYIQFAANLDGAAYTPHQLVERLRRLALADPAALPAPDELAEDLRALRLLELRDDGTYRRWPHLADAAPDHLLRYAALTLLLPAPGGGVFVPLLAAPFDGAPHPVAACPGGAPLLAWYAEAGLVRRTPDGSWQSVPGALDPAMAGALPGPLGRTLATFLAHVQQARASRAPAPLEDAPLSWLDPAKLEARIAELQRELLIDRATLLRIYRALVAGHHVILSGPPGTGKTHLARLLPRLLWRDGEPDAMGIEQAGAAETVLWLPDDPTMPPDELPYEIPAARFGYATELATATEQWSTRDVIGGIVPRLGHTGSGGLAYTVRHGCLTRALLANYGPGSGAADAGSGVSGGQPPPGGLQAPLQRQEVVDAAGQRFRGCWLVIDEFTRAPIDAAFGPLLTALGGQQATLPVPAEDGSDVPVRFPRDFRILATLNSFDRHFLNQMSEALKRRFTFIDILPPARAEAAAEEAMAVYHALLRLAACGLPGLAVEPQSGHAVWAGVLSLEPAAPPDDWRPVLTVEDAGAAEALRSFWRILAAVRVYRRLGTAQAEAVCSALFSGRSSGMDWRAALDAALADTLADQLQVLARDEQRVLLALLAYAATPERFAAQVARTLERLPGPRRAAHLALLKAAEWDGGDARTHLPDDLDEPADLDDVAAADAVLARFRTAPGRVFSLGVPLLLDADGLFAQRLRGFVRGERL